MPNKLSQFWQELKRRKVIKAIAMYAGGAYVLIELSNNVAVPLNLPDWTPKLVILIALIGFPIMVILSWIFDITPEGIDKTLSIEDTEPKERTPQPGKRKLKVSDVIIFVLILLVGILAYPRIFRSGNLNAMTVPVTVVNEFGEKETRRVFKEDYLTRLALFPFSNEIHDSSMNWIGWGVLEAVLEDQHQFSNILIDWGEAIHLNEQIDFAREGRYPYFLTGTIQLDGSTFEITSRLYQTSNGSVKNEHVFRGTDFFGLIDTICVQVRSDVGISEVILNTTPDLPISDLMTDNLEAYGNYIQGRYYWLFNTFIIPLNKAIQIDSTFAKACYRYAYWCYNYQLSDQSAISKINQAIRHRHRLSEYSDIETRIFYNLIMGNVKSAVELSEYLYKLRPRDLNLLTRMFDTYLRLNELDRAEYVAIIRDELVPNHPRYQIDLADCYLLSGNPDKSVEVLDEVLKENPENVEALLKIGEAYLHVKDLNAAEEVFSQAIYLMPEQETRWRMFLDHVDFVRNKELTEDILKSYGNRIRNERGAFSHEIRIVNNQLSFKGSNQRGFFMYPVSDSVFVYAFKDGDTFNFLKSTWFFNNNGKAIKVKGEQWDGSNYILLPAWVEDSLILHAKDLLAAGQNSKALAKFREAYTQNPEHYYLTNYIRHLEFILASEHETLNSVFSSYVSYYGDLSFYMEAGRLFYTNYSGLIIELLPLSEDRFMVPSIYELQIQMVKDKNIVTGLKFIHRDGTEEFFPKTPNEI